MQTVTPAIAASLSVSLISLMACPVQMSVSSGLPQLAEMTEGLFFMSWTAASKALIQPFSPQWAK